MQLYGFNCECRQEGKNKKKDCQEDKVALQSTFYLGM